MKRMISINIISKILIFTLVFIFTSMVFPSDVVFIYDTSASGAAVDFGALLADHGFTTDLVEKSDIPSIDLSNYNLIIIDSNTGSGSEWGTSEAVSNIQNSGKPIFGLGRGGASLFQVLSLSIGWGHCWTSSEGTDPSNTQILCVDPDLPIFNGITIPGDMIIGLYTSSARVAAHGASLSNEAVLIGREVEYDTHYSIVSEGAHVLWGFTHTPEYMTQVGKNLFINIVDYLIGGNVVDVSMDHLNVPESYELLQNYPNPFNPETAIQFTLPHAAEVHVVVYNQNGQDVVTITNEYFQSGIHSITFNASDLPSGIYLYRITAGPFTDSRKMLLMK